MLPNRTVEVQDRGDIDPLADEGQLIVDDDGLLSVLSLNYECFSHFLGINNATKHNILIFCYIIKLIDTHEYSRPFYTTSSPKGKGPASSLDYYNLNIIWEYDEKQKADDDLLEMITSPKGILSYILSIISNNKSYRDWLSQRA